MIGFFAIESMICRTVTGAVSRAFAAAEMADLWDDACGRLQSLFEQQVHSISSPSQMLQIKEELLLMAEAVSDDFFGLKPHLLYETMRTLWRPFEVRE